MTTPWATIIVAAGSGQRFGSDIPKQYARMGGRPVLAHTLEALSGNGPVVLVVDPSHASFYAPIIAGLRDITVVAGGATRRDSVLCGLEALAVKSPARVLIHDAARPFVEASAIARLKSALEDGAVAATLACPVSDTLLRGQETVDRNGLYAVQTPQAFDFTALLEAHRKAPSTATFTDDTTLMHAATGAETILVEGSPDNFKITHQPDLERAARLLLARYADVRTGLGFDVHRFGEAPAGGTIKLFGADIPSDRCLVGHSDADAGLHAVADAILGTIGAGDIGLIFPPSDPQWKGMDSALIVAEAIRRLHAAGGMLAHVDIMLMAEAPRIGQHRAAILARLSEILGLPEGRIGLKATTTEKMGSIGRGEGLAVQTIATVRLRT